MILRDLEHRLVNALERPVVALVGPRQSGKTTLALQIAQKIESKKSSYLDLELDSDLSKLDDTEGYLRRFTGQLLIIYAAGSPSCGSKLGRIRCREYHNQLIR